MESIFKYFQIQEVDFDKKKSEAGKCERTSPGNKTKNKAEITKESNSEKSKEKSSDITAGLLGTTNDPKKSKNGNGEDGMDSVIEKHGEAFEEVKGIEKTDGSESAQDGSESSEQKSEDDLDEIHENALKPGQEKSDELKEVKNKKSDHEQSGYSPGQDKKALKHEPSQAEGGSEPAKGSYDKKRSKKKEKRKLKKKAIKKNKLKKASEKSKWNEQKSENAIDEDVMKHESGISDECNGVDSKNLNIVEISTELNKETTSSEKQTEGDTFKTGPGTPDKINDASNSGACDNHPENSPEQDGKSMEGKEEILDSEDLSKKKAVDAGPNSVEMSTELNKETTSIDKKTEGDTFKTGPGTPDEINVASNSGACDNHPENSPEQDGKSMEGKEEILDSEDLSKKKAVDAGPNSVEMSTELNKETTSIDKKTEGDIFKTGPGTPDEINVASNSRAYDNHPENSPEQDGKSMEGKEEILDGEDLSKKAIDAKFVSSGASCATENQPAVSAPSNSNSGVNIIDPEGGEPSDEVVSSKKEEADNSSENVDPSKIDGSSANVEADMVGKPVTGTSGEDKPPQTGNLEQANFVKTSNGQDENGKNADKSTVLGETKNDGDDGTPASGAGTIGENLGSDLFEHM